MSTAFLSRFHLTLLLLLLSLPLVLHLFLSLVHSLFLSNMTNPRSSSIVWFNVYRTGRGRQCRVILLNNHGQRQQEGGSWKEKAHSRPQKGQPWLWPHLEWVLWAQKRQGGWLSRQGWRGLQRPAWPSPSIVLHLVLPVKAQDRVLQEESSEDPLW